MEGGLVGAQVHFYSVIGQAFPKIYHIAYVGKGDGLFIFDCFLNSWNEFIKAVVEFVHPSLLIALFCGLGVDFRSDAYHSGNVARLWLRTGHSAKTRRNKELACGAATLSACRVHHRDSCAVHNALRADVHIATGGHLAVLAHSHGVHALPVVGLGVVGDYHAVGDNDSWSILVAGEKAQRMAGIHHKRLLIGHGGQILHGEPVLSPVLEDGSVSAVDNQLVRVLGHSFVQVVLDHGHYCSSLL